MISAADHCQSCRSKTLATFSLPGFMLEQQLNIMQVARWLGKHGHSVSRLLICLDHDPRESQKWHTAYRGGCVGLLAQLPNLQHLNLSGGGGFLSASQHLYIMECLPKLLTLSVDFQAEGHWTASMLDPLHHLTALTSLNVKVSNLQGPLLVAPALAQLTQLKELSLECCHMHPQQHWTNQDHLFKTISQLTNLTQLTLQAMLDRVSAEIANLSQLVQLHLKEVSSIAQRSLNTGMVLPSSLALCSELEHLSLERLSHASVRTWWGICRSVVALSGLQSLTISETDLSHAPAADWALHSSLTYLQLSQCSLSKIPAAVCQLPDLREFFWSGSSLTQLETGPYLHNMRSMAIECDSSVIGTDVLRSAIHLNHLAVTMPCSEESEKSNFDEQLRCNLPAGCFLSVEGDCSCDNISTHSYLYPSDSD